jgi:hypothetical protein
MAELHDRRSKPARLSTPPPARLFALVAGLDTPTPEERKWLKDHREYVRVGRQIHVALENLQNAARDRRRRVVGSVT